MELFLAPQNLPFTVAIVVMLGLTVLEGVGLLFGSGVSEWMDGLLPDAWHLGSPDYDGPLAWLHLGKVPLLMLLIIFLVSFGLSGLLLQHAVHGISGYYLPGVVASVPAFIAALPVVRGVGGLIARVMPKDESSVVSEQALLGRTAVITLGVARQGQPAEAKLRDQHGQTHYVMVEPDTVASEFPAGTEVLLVKKLSAHYRAILNPHPGVLEP